METMIEKEIDILVFKTNIKYKKDLEKVQDILKVHPKITKWHVDLSDRDKVLRIESIDLLPHQIINQLQQVGFSCDELPD